MTATDTITVYVDNELSEFIPSAFTPNNDGLNDRFAFDILGATNLDIKIFNRWGQEVYGDANQQNGLGAGIGWDGNVDGKPAPNDTYVWQLKVTYFGGDPSRESTKETRGTVSIMKITPTTILYSKAPTKIGAFFMLYLYGRDTALPLLEYMAVVAKPKKCF